jgi:hypothetical protein
MNVLQPHPAWPFPTRHETVCTLAQRVIADANRTPDDVEAAIKSQGYLIESHVNAGRMEPAREAAKVVLQLNQMRTPETVARMEQERGLS